MSLRRLRLAPLVLAAVAALALVWGAGAAPGWSAHDAAHDAEGITSFHLEAPAIAAGGDERFDVRAERNAKSRGIPLALVGAALAGATALRRRHRAGDGIQRLVPYRSDALGRAPPALLVTTN